MSVTLPEELLVAVLYKAGTIRIADNERLGSLFDNAAKEFPDTFGEFLWHPVYHYSKTLLDALSILWLGGSIIRESPELIHFRATSHTLGEHGQRTFLNLPESDQQAVEIVAQRVCEAFS